MNEKRDPILAAVLVRFAFPSELGEIAPGAGAQSANDLFANVLFLENPQQAPAADRNVVGPLGESDQRAAWVENAEQFFSFARPAQLGENFLLAQAQSRNQLAAPRHRG